MTTSHLNGWLFKIGIAIMDQAKLTAEIWHDSHGTDGLSEKDYARKNWREHLDPGAAATLEEIRKYLETQ